MRLVKYILIFVAITFGDETKIVCDHGTRDFDSESLLEAAYGDMTTPGTVTSLGCQDTVTSGQLVVSGQTNVDATHKLIFTTQPGVVRRINYTSGNGIILVTGFTEIKNLHISNTSGGVVSYISSSAGGNILYDGVIVFMDHASNYGFGQESGTTNEFRNCVIKQSVASPNPGLYGYNSGTNVKINNCTFKMVGATIAINSLNAGVTYTITNTAIKAATCLGGAFSPTYVKSKVYTSDATGTNTGITDPQFNFDTDGYTLLTGSALINAGLDVAGFTNSINGVTRPSGYWDVGAYELASGNPSTGGRRCSILWRNGLAPYGR